MQPCAVAGGSFVAQSRVYALQLALETSQHSSNPFVACVQCPRHEFPRELGMPELVLGNAFEHAPHFWVGCDGKLFACRERSNGLFHATVEEGAFDDFREIGDDVKLRQIERARGIACSTVAFGEGEAGTCVLDLVLAGALRLSDELERCPYGHQRKRKRSEGRDGGMLEQGVVPPLSGDGGGYTRARSRNGCFKARHARLAVDDERPA